MKPIYFKTASELQDWLERHGTSASELLLGFFKIGSGRATITYHEALESALCFGWIDGVRRNVDQNSYSIRFTPRQPKSTWSRINIKKAEALRQAGRMRPPGLKAFEARTADRSGLYSFENPPRQLQPGYQREFKRNQPAWTFFQARPPWYRRVASFWVMSAKKEETRRKRLATLIADSAKGRNIKPLTRSTAPKRFRASRDFRPRVGDTAH